MANIKVSGVPIRVSPHVTNVLTNSDLNSGGITKRCHLLVTYRTTSHKIKSRNLDQILSPTSELVRTFVTCGETLRVGSKLLYGSKRENKKKLDDDNSKEGKSELYKLEEKLDRDKLEEFYSKEGRRRNKSEDQVAGTTSRRNDKLEEQ